MIDEFYYNEDTKAFGWGSKLTVAATLAGTAASLATLPKQLSDKARYGVAGVGSNGKPISKTVRALSGVDAIRKVKSTHTGSRFRAFKIPEQDDEYQDYMTQLSN